MSKLIAIRFSDIERIEIVDIDQQTCAVDIYAANMAYRTKCPAMTPVEKNKKIDDILLPGSPFEGRWVVIQYPEA